jgi:hypothetical protein
MQGGGAISKQGGAGIKRWGLGHREREGASGPGLDQIHGLMGRVKGWYKWGLTLIFFHFHKTFSLLLFSFTHVFSLLPSQTSSSSFFFGHRRWPPAWWPTTVGGGAAARATSFFIFFLLFFFYFTPYFRFWPYNFPQTYQHS